jgi:hypothetical protein
LTNPIWGYQRSCNLTTAKRRSPLHPAATPSVSKIDKSDTSPKRRKKKKSERLFETTHKLLDTNSKWTTDEWKTAERSLYALSRQPKNTARGIQALFHLLTRMVSEAESNSFFSITTQHLNIVLDKWRIGTRYKVVDRKKYSAPQVVALMDNFISKIPTLIPDSKSYALIMAVQIKLDPLRSPEFCTGILNRMKSSDNSTASPNTIILTYLMDAHVKSQQQDSAFKVVSIFDHMVNSKDPNMAPTEKSLTRVMQALSTSPLSPDQVLPHMERVLDCMLMASIRDPRCLPNSLFLNLTLSFCDNAYAKKRASGARLADTLMTLVHAKSKEFPKIAPDATAFGSIISILVKSNLSEAPGRATHWLQQMIAASKENKKLVPQPRASIYTSIISAWECSGLPEAPIRGESLFLQMVDNTQNITDGAYYLLISLWSKSNLSEAPGKAEDLLRQMIKKSRYNQRLSPSLSAYVNVISGWKRNNEPHRAQAVLDLMLEEHRKYPQELLNNVPFNATINAWAASGLPEAETKVELVLASMNVLAEKHPSAAPSIVTAWSAMQCLSPGSEDAPIKALKLLTLMDSDYGRKNQHLRGQLYEGALSIWSNCVNINRDATLESERILRKYLSEPNKNRTLNTTKTCIGFAMKAWKKSNLPEAEERLESILKDLEKEAALLHKRSSNLDLYAFLAHSWAKSGLSNANQQVQRVVDIIVEECKGQDRQPKQAWFSEVMRIFAELGALQHMQDFLGNVHAMYTRESNESQMSDMYLVAIHSLLEHNETEGARNILEEMLDLFNNGDHSVKPSTRCFGPLMLAYSEEGNHKMVERLWRQLQLLQTDNPDPSFSPDVTVLTALCSLKTRHAATEYSILYELLGRSTESKDAIPNESLIYSVLDSLVKSGKSSAGNRAEMILLKMQELFEEGRMAQPTFQAFQKVINCWVVSDMESATERAERVLHFAETLSEDGDKHLQPSYDGYTSVIQAWAKSCRNEAPERIQRHMRKMQQRHDDGDSDFKLDAQIFSALIEAYATSGRDDAKLMANAVFDNAPSEHRNTRLYNALIFAQGGDAIQAESILNKMHEQFLNGNSNTKPNTQTFNNLIMTWSKSGSPMAAWRADSIFQRMEELSRKGELDVKPDSKTFDTVIATLTNDWGADAARKVDRYLELVKEYYQSGATDCMPSVASYTEAIRAWGSNVDDPRAVLRAKALLDEMNELAGEGAESVKPNQDTYLVYLRALSQSDVEGKAQLAKDVLISMKDNGVELDKALLSEIQRCSLPLGVVEKSWKVPIGESVADDIFPKSIEDPLESRLQSLRTQ